MQGTGATDSDGEAVSDDDDESESDVDEYSDAVNPLSSELNVSISQRLLSNGQEHEHSNDMLRLNSI